MKRYRLKITGIVQGVGFRPFVYRVAIEEGLRGFVKNNSSCVIAEVEGDEKKLDRFLQKLRVKNPPASRIDSIEIQELGPVLYRDFRIIHSGSDSRRDIVIPPDIAICEDCKREVLDPSDRRYYYPFINCTNCGPRYTIIKDLPYDRVSTTMNEFEMCDICRREYEDPMNRRFHAQPNACPECGPEIWIEDGKVLRHDVGGAARGGPTHIIQNIARLLKQGKIVAIKGLGGFHLACDANNDTAVNRLRKIKNRPSKPFAIMVPDIEWARKIAEIGPDEEELLLSWQAPIVLLKLKKNAPISPLISPGLDTVGIMLPYTPLHLLILKEFDGPLVMTSGNVSDSPIIYKNEDILETFSGKVDDFVLHNREIYMPIDDSIARVSGRRVQILRRARGFVPLAIETNINLDQTILAFGGLLKGTFTYLKDGKAYMGQYIGDLDNYDNQLYYKRVLSHFEKLFGLNPDIVACDLHPQYPTTYWAEESDLPVKKVQHHVAHVYSVIGEHGLYERKFLAFSFDGTGWGEDGKVWGGEIFIGKGREVRRVGHFSYFPLPTGDAAIKNPWRVAAGLFYQLFGRIEVAPWFDKLGDLREEAIAFEKIIRSNTLYTSSAGRLLDAFSSLIGVRHRVDFEAQAPMELEALMDSQENVAYDVKTFEENGELILDSEDFFHHVYEDLIRGINIPRISARIHNTFIRLIKAVVSHFEGNFDVVIVTGGVFQNRFLTEKIVELLGDRVYINQQVPPNDGGISFGQAIFTALNLED